MPSNHLILCHPVLLLPSISATMRVFSNGLGPLQKVTKVLELQLQHQSFQWIFRIDFLAVQEILKSLLQNHNSVQFSSVTQSCLTLCNPMDCSTPSFPVHHQHPELAQTHVHQVGDDVQLSHPLSSPSPPNFNLSQHQGLFQWVSSSHQVAKVLEF